MFWAIFLIISVSLDRSGGGEGEEFPASWKILTFLVADITKKCLVGVVYPRPYSLTFKSQLIRTDPCSQKLLRLICRQPGAGFEFRFIASNFLIGYQDF